MKKWMVPLILLGLLFGAWYVSTLKTPPSRPPESPPESPPPTDLRAQLEKIEKETEQAVRTYAPKKLDRIDNLSISVEPIIKSLPGVEKVIVTGAKNPTKRIIHIVDWHFVDKDDYRIDMEHAHAKKLTDAEFDEMYRELLLVVEMVQAEQMGLHSLPSSPRPSSRLFGRLQRWRREGVWRENRGGPRHSEAIGGDARATRRRSCDSQGGVRRTEKQD